MKKFLTALCATAVLATGLIGTSVAPASADGYRSYRGYDRHYDDRRYYRHRRGNNTGEILGAGAIGLAAGALLGGALSSNSYNRGDINEGRVYNQGPVYYRRAPVRTYRGYDHVSACESRYRTYDARSDTFIGYDGNAHPCRL